MSIKQVRLSNQAKEQLIRLKTRFEINSKDPVGIVRSALSRHSVENQHACASKTKHFSQRSGSRFTTFD